MAAAVGASTTNMCECMSVRTVARQITIERGRAAATPVKPNVYAYRLPDPVERGIKIAVVPLPTAEDDRGTVSEPAEQMTCLKARFNLTF
jgi:hypothetical protein